MRGNRSLSSVSNFVRTSQKQSNHQSRCHQVIFRSSSSSENLSRECNVQQSREISTYYYQYRSIKNPYVYSTSLYDRPAYLTSSFAFLSTTTDGGDDKNEDLLRNINDQKETIKDAVGVNHKSDDEEDFGDNKLKNNDDKDTTSDLAPLESTSSMDATSSSPIEKVVGNENLKPKELVDYLDKYIVGQKEAKKAIAIALRNRWRRFKLPDDLRTEVVPKNILMIGPTGCGKTEIARRIAKLSNAPFIKVEATKFTEVGFHGRDVDQIIRDLVEVSIQMQKKKRAEKVKKEADLIAKEKIIDVLLGKYSEADVKNQFMQLLENGQLDKRVITIDVPVDKHSNLAGIGSNQGASTGSTPNLFPSSGSPGLGQGFTDNTTNNGNINSGQVSDFLGRYARSMMYRRPMEKKKVPVSEARTILTEMEMEKLVDISDVTREAIKSVEESGIVFLDEIDKICNNGDYRGADASAEGVQRDLLPLIEGSTISTKYGNVNTDFILFVTSGAFHECKPSDLLAELQGRLPIRVELQALTEDDMYKILTEPVTNLIRQQEELLLTEDVRLKFSEEAIREIARVAALVNKTVENIGARRLHTIIERVVEELSYQAPEFESETEITVTKEMVNEKVDDLLLTSDMSKYIL